MIVSLLQWSMASFVGIQSRKLGILNVGSLTPYVIVWLVGASVCDILIAVTMVTIVRYLKFPQLIAGTDRHVCFIQLFQAGGRSAFQRTKSLTMKLITLTVNTGMITALWAIGDLIVFVSLQHSNWHTIPFLMLSKLYAWDDTALLIGSHLQLQI
ncbi:hypothetical protein DXG01_010510 [Tephrocybe rancida]|nr:hypothetical protein DXG01_010510 [Tephrocybe rancida]